MIARSTQQLSLPPQPTLHSNRNTRRSYLRFCLYAPCCHCTPSARSSSPLGTRYHSHIDAGPVRMLWTATPCGAHSNNAVHEEDVSCSLSVGSLTEQDLFDHDYGAVNHPSDGAAAVCTPAEDLQSPDASPMALRLVRRDGAWLGWDMHVLEGSFQDLSVDSSDAAPNSLPTSPEDSPRSPAPGMPATRQGADITPFLQPAPRLATAWSLGAAANLAPLTCPEHPVSCGQDTPTPPFARSCPRPIVQRNPGQLARKHYPDQEDETCFMPPHQMLASADPTQSVDAVRCRGSAMIRLRAGVLRKTGYFDGQTEVLRSAPRLGKGV